MSFAERMRAKAISMGKKLVLPEGTERRTIEAARKIKDEKIAAEVILVGSSSQIEKVAGDLGVSLEGIIISDPTNSQRLEAYGKEYYNLRKHKGLSEADATEAIKDPLKWGAMMVRLDDADAIVAGAENTTGTVLLTGFTIIKTAPGVKSASSCFVMEFPDKKWGVDGQMIFSDCGTIPDPTTEQLAEIAMQASQSCRNFFDAEPITAMLSFSTKGSAKHPNVDKVVNALAIVKEVEPTLKIDGEFQLDAAIVPSIGEKKAPGSSVAGYANTLIFPDLQSGNIGYKLSQRLAGAEAYGPILQGFAKPISDLSRGCSVEDIITVSAIAISQAKN